MRIRYPFLAAFLLISLLAAFLGLSTIEIPQVNDKLLHFLAFFLLTVTFYWIFDSSRRRIFNLTLLFITIFAGIGSEGLQWLVTARQFDPLDVAGNVIGSFLALILCGAYHKRMLDRRRRAKGYGLVPQQGEADVEMAAKETGVADQEPVVGDKMVQEDTPRV